MLLASWEYNMYLNLEANPAKYQIQQCTDNSVTINTIVYSQSILVMPQHLASWRLNNVKDLAADHLLELAELRPEIILLGTGCELIFPNPTVMQALFPNRIGVEVMTTAAACRTYTALTSEYRNVLAALIVNT